MRSARIRNLVAVVAIAFALVCSVAIFFAPSGNRSLAGSMLIAAGACTLIYFLRLRRIHGRFPWVSISFLFVLSYYIVYFQIPMLELAGYHVSEQAYRFIWSNEPVFVRSVAASSSGLLAFYLGSILGFRRSTRDGSEVKVAARRPNTLLLAIATYCLFVCFLATSGSYVLGDYTPSDASGWSSYFYKLFKISLSAFVLLRVAYAAELSHSRARFSEYVGRLGISLLVILGAHMALCLLVGDRGPLIYFLLLSFGMYFVRFRRINGIHVVVGIVTLAAALSAIGQIRQARFSGADYQSRLADAVTESDFFTGHDRRFAVPVPLASTIELALSIRTLNHALANVPSLYPFGCGIFQMNHLYSIIPGLSKQMNRLLFDGDKIYDGTSNFITYLIQGRDPSYGDGTSVVADLYLDFGIVGVVGGLILFGWFVGRNEGSILRGKLPLTLSGVATMLLFCNSLYLARSALMLEMSNIVLVYLAISSSSSFGRQNMRT